MDVNWDESLNMFRGINSPKTPSIGWQVKKMSLMYGKFPLPLFSSPHYTAKTSVNETLQ